MSTPTPTDPREAVTAEFCAQTNQELSREDLHKSMEQLQSTNSKLAAEIAELKEQKRPFSDKLAGEVIDGQVKRIAELETKLSTVSTELEELEAKYDELHGIHVERLAELEAARKERDQINEAYDSAIGRATDKLIAAEKRAANAENYIRKIEGEWQRVKELFPEVTKDGWLDLALNEAAALTSAPTQEPPAGKLPIGTKIRFLKTLYSPPNEEHPYLIYAHKDETGEITGYNNFEGYFVRTDRWQTPFGASLGTEFEPLPPAGGVTISNDSPDQMARRQEQSETAGGTSNAPQSGAVTISTEKKGEQHARPETLAEETPLTNSPADVPSEGRGELLPFNLSDALDGKPVVTRDGRTAVKIQGDKLLGGTVNGIYYNWYRDGKCTNGNPLHDLFMLPTEGSGA